MKLVLPLLWAITSAQDPLLNLDWETDGMDCKDDNVLDGDGCNNLGHIELGWTCYNAGVGFGSVCFRVCGDGIDDKQDGYLCDDGNLLNGDGCDSACQIEAAGPWACTDGVVGLPWTPYTCTENCDDVNLGTLPCDDSTNRCCNTCQIDDSGVWQYNHLDRSCTEICGNGIMVTGSTKECEDGKANAGDEYFGDGCDWRCYLEDTTQPGPPYTNFIWQDSWTRTNEATVTSLTDDSGVTFNYNKDVFTERVADRYYDFYNYECQDDNVAAGDGCDPTMQIEDGWECWSGNPIKPDICYEICSDGKDYFDWWCEDHNLESGDGCSATCMIERGYDCVGGTPTTVDVCTEICADGIDFHTYDCDDGNSINGDGCTDACELEAGWKCIDGDFDRADMCIEICGDGLRILNDGSCDDGNIFDGDGCSSVCDIETGWECAGGSSTSRDTCWETCADGINAGGVECDDGNTRNGDGCDDDCDVELGYYCEGGDLAKPDTCFEICGDSRNMGVNECDDGNVEDGDGCSSTCVVENGWYCFDGDINTRDTCRQNPQPSIISAVLTEDNSLVTLTFNTTMLLNTDWVKTDLRLFVHGPKDKYKVKWTLEDSDYLKTTAVNEYTISVDLEDQIYEGVEQFLVVDFTNVFLYMGATEFRELLNETAWMELNVQENQSNKYCNSSGLLYAVLGLLGLFAVFSIFAAIFANMSLFPLVYLITSVQYLQVTPVMDLLFPTCLKTFFWQLRFLNFQGEFIYNALNLSDPEAPLNDKFKRHGYLSSEYFFNVMDILVLCAVFIVLLFVFMIVKRLMTDVVFMQNISQRYITNSIQDIIILIYFKHALACFMYWEQRNIDNWFQFLSACLNILMTAVVFIGWPLVQALMILKKNCLFWKLDREKQKRKAEKEAKKQDLFVQAEEHVEENKKKDPAVDNYLTYLQDPDGKHAEEEARKKAAEKKRKAAENFTDSEEDEEFLAKKDDFERKKMQKKFNSSYLFNCLWQDLNHHYNFKLFWYCLFAAKRIYFAKVLIDYRDDGCTQIKQLLLLSIISLAFVVSFKPFKYRYYQQCAVNDEFWTTIACGTYFAFYHENSGKYTVEYFSIIVMVSILAMVFFSFVFVIMEMIRRLDPKYAEWAEPVIDEGEEPEKKQKKPKKEKKKKKKGEAPDIELVEAKRRQKEEEERRALTEKSQTEEQSSYQSEDVTLSESAEDEESSDEFDRSSGNDEIQAQDIVADDDDPAGGEQFYSQNQKINITGGL